MAEKCTRKWLGSFEGDSFVDQLSKCSKEYNYLKWIDYYYRMSHGILLLPLVIICFAICVYCVQFLCDEFVAESIY